MIFPYLWMVIVGAVVCFLVACGNGANDLANAFGTSYGSRVLTLMQIIVIATCCEFAGAVGLGSNVATTMSGGIAKVTTFDKDPYVLMYGFMCTLGATFIWLMLATKYNLPVSSHHSVAGGIIGFALVYGGGDAVTWAGSKSTFPFVSGVVPIIISWFISPLLAGIVAAIIYALCRFLILERKNAKDIATYAMPVVVACTFFLELLFIFMIAASSKLSWTIGHTAWMAAAVGGGVGVLSIGLIPVLRMKIRTMERKAAEQAEEEGITVEEVLQRLVVCGRLKSQKSDKKTLVNGEGNGEEEEGDASGGVISTERNEAEIDEEQRRLFNRLLNSQHHDEHDEPVGGDGEERAFHGGGLHQQKNLPPHTLKQRRSQQRPAGLGEEDGNSGLGYDAAKLHPPQQAEGNVVRDDDDDEDEDDDEMSSDDVHADERRRQSHNGDEEQKKKKKKKYGHYTYGPGGVHFFDPRAEYLFRFLQVLTAACTSLAHGSNDVSNSIGPFAAIYNIYRTQEASNSADIPVWLLCIGGAGIVVGLATYGLNIMRLLGEKLAIITPVRGFSAELATALVVCFATTYSIPISSTHCITGAVLAISWMDMGTCGVKWMMVLKMYGGWIMTLVITGVISACFFAQGINSPMKTE